MSNENGKLKPGVPREYHHNRGCANEEHKVVTAESAKALTTDSRRIKTTAIEDVEMVFSSSNLILCSPFLYRNPGKKNPPLS